MTLPLENYSEDVTDTYCVSQSKSLKHSICHCRPVDCYFVSFGSPEHTSICKHTKLVAQAETKRSLPLTKQSAYHCRLTPAHRRRRRRPTGDITHLVCRTLHAALSLARRSFVEAGIPAMRQYFRLCYYLPATMHARPGIFISQTFRQKTLAGERRNAVELSMHSSVTPYKQYTS
jgi:hypothetical protein